MKNLAIIPARGGSKRIPKKNIKHFCGRPIIAYSIEAAINSNLFDEVMVSTDDDEIARLAISLGAHVPFKRSPENSNDFATTADVLIEVLNNYRNQEQNFDYGCCIYPTAPFITAKSLKSSFDHLLKNKFSSLFPVVKFSYPIQRALRLADGRISMVSPENLNKRSQDLEPAYHDSGQYYWLDTNDFMMQKVLFMKNSGAIVIDEMCAQDIDTETDWQLAELKFQLLGKREK